MSTATLLTGKRGEGKSLAAVARIRDYLQQGRVVATNLNVFPDKFLPSYNSKARIYRLPDHPTVDDLLALPSGNESSDESKNGLLVLDEAATFLNARTWQEGKARQDVISWFLHSRKYGWDLILISQHANLLDKQLRDSLFEYHGITRRMDKLRIPFLSAALRLFDVDLKMPKIHVVVIRYGMQNDSPVADRWIFRGHDLYRAYDTRQVIDPAHSPGLHTVLPPFYTRGRYMGKFQMYKPVMITGLLIGAIVGVVAGGVGVKIHEARQLATAAGQETEQKFESATVTGLSRFGARMIASLSDGRVVDVDVLNDSQGIKVKSAGKWYKQP